METNANVHCDMAYEAKAIPEEGMSLDELEKLLVSLGNKIIRRDPDGIVIGKDSKRIY